MAESPLSIDERKLLESFPVELEFECPGVGSIITQAKLNKERSRVWFEGEPTTEVDGKVVPALIVLDTPESASPIASIPVEFQAAGQAIEALPGWLVNLPDGSTVELNAGEVHVSEPRKYKKGHQKAGQPIPGTGGNITATWSGLVVVARSTGEATRFTAMAIVTYNEEADAFSGYAKLIARPASRPARAAVGRSTGFTTVARPKRERTAA